MQALASEAISQDRDAVDPAALAAQICLCRSAALAGASQTAARSGPLMKAERAGPPPAQPPGRLPEIYPGPANTA
jgi:hypothetical protein